MGKADHRRKQAGVDADPEGHQFPLGVAKDRTGMAGKPERRIERDYRRLSREGGGEEFGVGTEEGRRCPTAIEARPTTRFYVAASKVDPDR